MAAELFRVLERRRGDEETFDVALGERALHALVDAADVARAKPPVVARVEAERAQIEVDCAEAAHHADRVLHLQRALSLGRAVAALHQLAVGDGRVGVRDDVLALDALAVLGDDAARAAVLDEDLGDRRSRADLSAVTAELFDERARDRLRAAARIKAAVEIMFDHDRVRRDRDARGREAVVAARRGEDDLARRHSDSRTSAHARVVSHT
ncbi:MAG TPA: hypothetical protein VGH28_02795 [Polyangiaceae bacterium]